MITTTKQFYNPQETSSLIADTGVEKTSTFLDKIKVTIVSGGGIAAVEVPRLTRELRRHGADVQICITENCLKFIGLESLRWASQNEVILHPSGLSEHICTSDMVVIAPATADLISKIKNGICSDAATTFVQSALGANKPIIFCQTMHDSLANSPIIMENRNYLKKIPNIFFIEPRKEEGKQKIPDVETLAMNICHIANKQRKNIKEEILLTYGGSRVMLDPVRCLTNLSTGSLGIEVAKLFYGMGYKLTILAANTTQKLPAYEGIHVHSLPDYLEMFEFALNLNTQQFNGLIHLVAAADFIPDSYKESKISSSCEKIILTLSKSKKLLSETSLKDIPYKAAAKLTAIPEAESELTHANLSVEKDGGFQKAKILLTENNLNAVFWSTASEAWNKDKPHAGVFLERNKNSIHQEKIIGKKQIALCYFNSFVNSLEHVPPRI